MPDKVRLFCYNTDTAGCYWYRLFTPMNKIKELAGDKFEFNFKIQSVDDVSKYDIVILQRPTDALAIEIAEKAKNCGIPVVFEIDDSLFNIDPVNPAHKYYARKDIEYCIKYLLSYCDGMSVSTEPLYDYYKGYLSDTCKERVLPNSVDLNYYFNGTSKIPKRPGCIRVLLTGSISHNGDWAIIKDTIYDVLMSNKNVEFVLFGHLPEYFKHDKRIVFVQPVKVEQYFESLYKLNFDLMLVPLEEIEFNKYKSNLKFVEAGALKIPCIASKVFAYETTITSGENGWLLPNKVWDWTKWLRKITKDPDLIKSVGSAAYQTVKEKFDLSSTVHHWINFYNELLEPFGKKITVGEANDKV